MSGRLNFPSEKKHHDKFFCIGGLRKGILWETTAIKEIREQAIEIANHIV